MTEHFQMPLVVAPEKGRAFSGIPTILFQKAKTSAQRENTIACLTSSGCGAGK
jgi:hypothetical protein